MGKIHVQALVMYMYMYIHCTNNLVNEHVVHVYLVWLEVVEVEGIWG